jgi:hypothetical protein
LVLLMTGAAAAAEPEAAGRVARAAPATRPAGERAVPKDPAARMAAWFAELGHTDPAVRDAARVGLMGLPRKDLPALERLVRDSVPLVPSQAVVLREIVTQVFLSGEKYDSTSGDGFLGVKPAEVYLNFREPQLQNDGAPFGGVSDPGAVYGVVINERMPGFCGARMLQDGDVILSIVERANLQFRDPSGFSMAVRQMGAGQTVRFQVLRQGQIIRVPITLDPRPDDADLIPGGVSRIQGLLNDRKAAADEYWEKTFAPLLKEGVG